MTIHRDGQAEGQAYRRGRSRNLPRMYQPIWERLYNNPDKMHCLMVPLENHERVKKALHKERWLHDAGTATHKLIIRALNDQCLLASWTRHSGIKLQADIDHLYELSPEGLNPMEEGSKFLQLKEQVTALVQKAMNAGKAKPSSPPKLIN